MRAEVGQWASLKAGRTTDANNVNESLAPSSIDTDYREVKVSPAILAALGGGAPVAERELVAA